MRFLHTSDWHLGRTLHGVDLLDAQRGVLRQLVELVADPPDGVGVDAVLVAGDVYDRAVPPLEAVALLADVLAELSTRTTVILTGGNHDSAIRLGFGSRLFHDRLHVRTDLASVGVPVLLGDEAAIPVAVYPLPYLEPDAARVALADGAEPLARSHQAVMAAAVARVRADLARRPAGTRSVVVAHAFVVGGQVSDSERSITVGGVDSVTADTFSGIDYVALGHLHGPQAPRTSTGATIRYSGSPLRYSFSEASHDKSVTLVDLDPSGPPRVQTVPLAQPRAMVELTDPMANLTATDTVARHRDDWVKLTVTDRARPDRMYELLKARYPHALQVLHAPAGAAPALRAIATAQTAGSTPRELGAEFVDYVTGVAADGRELELFEQAYEAALAEVGVE